MNDVTKESNYEVLQKYGAKWAVLQAMCLDLKGKGVQVKNDTSAQLDRTRIEIGSGCYSACEVDCTLNKVEAALVTLGTACGDNYLEQWWELLAVALKGQLTFEKIAEIPILKPVATDCGFLQCACDIDS